MVVRLAVQSLSQSSGSTWCSRGVPANLKPPASNLGDKTCTLQADVSSDRCPQTLQSLVADLSSKPFLHVKHTVRPALLKGCTQQGSLQSSNVPVICCEGHNVWKHPLLCLECLQALHRTVSAMLTPRRGVSHLQCRDRRADFAKLKWHVPTLRLYTCCVLRSHYCRAGMSMLECRRR